MKTHSKKDVQDNVQDNIQNDDYTTVLVGLAKKLSPSSTGLIGYEVAKDLKSNVLYIRLTSNSDGGLFSKEWIKLDEIYDLIQKLGDKPFNSSAFKTLFKSGSANNTSFIAAVLRHEELALIQPTEKKVFLHLANPLIVNQQDRIAKLKPLATPNKVTK